MYVPDGCRKATDGIADIQTDVCATRVWLEARQPCSTCVRLRPVGKYEELRLRILQGASDANINFDDLRHLLQWLGFEERTRGSHHIFRRNGVRELINLQREGSKAKVYQVRQVRQVVVRYGLEGAKE